MSIKAIQAVWDYSESRGNDRLVLLAIADASDHDGTGCFKGKETLAAMARCDRATVTRSILDLESSGELEVERRPGRSSLYRVVLPGIADPAQNAPTNAAQVAPPGAQNAPTPGARVRRDPSSNRSSSIASAVESDLDSQRRAQERIYAENAEREAEYRQSAKAPMPASLRAYAKGAQLEDEAVGE